MTRTLLLYTQDNTATAALLEDEQLVEYKTEAAGSSPVPGDILLGRITSIHANLSAAFVDIGTARPGFLPLEKEQLTSLRSGIELPVEIRRMPEGSKGYMLSDKFSLRTARVVLSYGNSLLGVSKKITDEKERLRLKHILKSFPVHPEVGYILRSEAVGMVEEALQKEASLLNDLFREVQKKARYTRVGGYLYRSSSFACEMLLTLRPGTLDRIIADERQYASLKQAAPLSGVDLASLSDTLREYKDSMPLSDLYRIPSFLKEAESRTVYLPDSGYLYIEKTEAAYVIDVNSGKDSPGDDHEASSLAIDRAAACEVARQIRLRDLTGIILIDFINLTEEAHRQEITDLLEECLECDSRKHTVYGFTRLQLMEMTRSRS